MLGGSSEDGEDVSSFRRQSWVALLAVLLAFGAGWWAARTTLQGPSLAPRTQAPVIVAVQQASVGKALTFNAIAKADRVPLARNRLVGIVTSVTRSERRSVGSVVYRVGDVPVRVVVGEVPFWRDLSEGMVGDDVNQLSAALVSLGFLKESVDPRKFTSSTRAALEEWQRALGIAETGKVKLGELVAVPSLPAIVSLDSKAALGSDLGGGESVLFVVGAEPEFTMRLTGTQAEMVPTDATVTVSFQGKAWSAVIAARSRLPGDTVELRLTAPGGGSLCAPDCSLLMIDDQLSLMSVVQIVPPVSGPAVPVAAIHIGPDGRAVVDVVEGSSTIPKEVTVKGSQNGMAVVSGVTVGEKVQVMR